MLYGELTTGSRDTVLELLRCQDVFKWDMKADSIDPAAWKADSRDRRRWSEAFGKNTQLGERLRQHRWEAKKTRRRQR